ncbi:ribonuclease P protein component [Patescibacteria group bacterium]|nr:ribonuclease P protein component [Patescibacteria group bacterium]
MFEKQFRLTKAKDFEKLGTKGRSVYGPFMVMRVRPVSDGPKVAFITSTKVFKSAVDRNRVKRRLRHVLKTHINEVPNNVHILFIVKREALKAPHDELAEEARRLILKIPEALKKPPKLSPRAQKMKEKRKGKA